MLHHPKALSNAKVPLRIPQDLRQPSASSFSRPSRQHLGSSIDLASSGTCPPAVHVTGHAASPSDRSSRPQRHVSRAQRRFDAGGLYRAEQLRRPHTSSVLVTARQMARRSW